MLFPCNLAQICMALVAAAQPIAPGDDDLDIQVVPHKTALTLGEPLIVTMFVKNQTQETVEIIYHNAPTLSIRDFSTVDLLFGADPEHLKHWSDDLRALLRVENRRMLPGERLEYDLVMLFNRKDGFFAKTPGRYWIAGRAVIVKDRKYVELLTEPIEIEVREPSPTERGTWLWLDQNKEEYGRLVQIPWEAKPSEGFLAECDRLCRETSTHYVEYLSLFLSRWYKEGPSKDAEKSTRYAEIAKARASSEKIRTEAEKLLPPTPPSSAP